MAVRRWQVHPDVQVPTSEYGMVPAVSRGLIDQAFLDGAAMVANAGGLFTVMSGRHPTDLPGGMLTTGLICEWADRTDAKPQPEQQSDVLPAVAETELDGPGIEGALEAEQRAQEAAEAVTANEEIAADRQDLEAVAEAAFPDSSDGLDEAQLEEEDLSEVEGVVT